MTELGRTRLRCPDCDAGYHWRPKLAGRKVRCACGAVWRMPMEPRDKPALLLTAAEVGQRTSVGAVVPLGEPDDPSGFRPEPPARLPPFIEPSEIPGAGPPVVTETRIERPPPDEDAYELVERVDVEADPAPAAPPAVPAAPKAAPPQLDPDAPAPPDEFDAAPTPSQAAADHDAPRVPLEPERDGSVPLAPPPRPPRCPNCGLTIKPEQVLCLNCGLNQETGARVKTAVVAAPVEVSAPGEPAGGGEPIDAAQAAAVVAAAPAMSAARAALSVGASAAGIRGGGATLRVEDDDTARRKARFIDLYLPLALIGIGAAVVLAHALLSRPGGLNTRPLVSSAIELVIAIPLLFAGLIVAAKVRDVEFGTLGPALLKITSMVMFVNAITQAGVWMMGPAGSLLGLIFLLPSYWILVAVLFRLDALEAWWVVVVLLAVRIILFCASIGLGLTLFA